MVRILALLAIATAAWAEDLWTTRDVATVPFRFHRSLSPERVDFLVADLAALARLAPSSNQTAMHRDLFGGPPDGARYLDWIARRIRRFRFRPDTHLAAKARTKRGRRDVDLSQGYFDKPTRLERWGILIHEARHFDGKDHVLCSDFWEALPKSREPLAWIRGQRMCDADANGAFGAQIVFLGNVLRAEGEAVADGPDLDARIQNYLRFIPYARPKEILRSDLLAPID